MNNTGKFYRRPLAGQPIRYGTQAIGINMLKTMMKYFFSKTFLFFEIVILTMTSWHEKELFFYTWKSLIAVLNNAWIKKNLIYFIISFFGNVHSIQNVHFWKLLSVIVHLWRRVAPPFVWVSKDIVQLKTKEKTTKHDIISHVSSKKTHRSICFAGCLFDVVFPC